MLDRRPLRVCLVVLVGAMVALSALTSSMQADTTAYAGDPPAHERLASGQPDTCCSANRSQAGGEAPAPADRPVQEKRCAGCGLICCIKPATLVSNPPIFQTPEPIDRLVDWGVAVALDQVPHPLLRPPRI